MHQAPEFPAGPHQAPERRDMALIHEQSARLLAQPQRLRAALQGLRADQLDTRYRNWTVRQIAHHIADGMVNYFIRWKLALTEENPTIAPYNEGAWVLLADSDIADPMLSTMLFDGAVQRWGCVARAMRPEDFDRTFFHPQYQRTIALWQGVSIYAWHGEHHIGQLEWLRNHHRW